MQRTLLITYHYSHYNAASWARHGMAHHTMPLPSLTKPLHSSSGGPPLSHYSLRVEFTECCGIRALCSPTVHLHGLGSTGGGAAGGDNSRECGVSGPGAVGGRVGPGTGITASLASRTSLFHYEAQLLHFGSHCLVLIT